MRSFATQLWGERPPDRATKTVQVYVSRLRKALGEGVLLTRGGGYLLDIEPDQVDAASFERLAQEGREALERSDARNARRLLHQALDLWHGPPLADFAYRDARRALVDELGLEPSRELQALERAILTQDPALDAPARTRPMRQDRRMRRAAALVVLGGGLLLAAAIAAVIIGGEDESGGQRVAGNSLAVIDPESNRQVATVPTGVQPADVAAGAGHIWVANHGDDTVTQIDPERRAVVSTTSPRSSVGGLAVGARGVWIGDTRRSRLVRLDPGFRSVVPVRLTPGPEVYGTARSNPVAVGHGAIWVGRSYSSIARVDPETHKMVRLPVGNSPSAIATGAGGVWVADDIDNTVSRIDPASANAVTATTPVGRQPSAVAVGAGAVWVANTQGDTVARIDPRTAGVTRTIPVGRRPTGVAGRRWSGMGREQP
jgi:YVTN family beta-propeller protein